MEPVWIWGEDRNHVFRSLLTRFAAAQKINWEVWERCDSDLKKMNLLLTHGIGDERLKEDRAVLHGMAIGLGLSPEEAGRIAEECGVPAILVQFHK